MVFRGSVVRVAVAAALWFAPGCHAREPAKPPVVDPVLSLLPEQTQTLASFDLQKLRQSPLWQALAAGVGAKLQEHRMLSEMKVRTGFDPLLDLHRVVVAFPEDAREQGEFAVVVYGANLNELRLVAYARDRAALAGTKIEQQEHAGQRVWVQQGQGTLHTGLFIGSHTFILAGGAWGKAVASLVAAGGGPSAAASPEIANLCRRLGVNHAAWLASVVPSATRTKLAEDPRFVAASNVARVAVAINVESGLATLGRAELSTTEHAAALASLVKRYVLDARQSPQVMLLGLGPWLQDVRAIADGPHVNVQVQLPPDQAQTLVARLVTLVRTKGAVRP